MLAQRLRRARRRSPAQVGDNQVRHRGTIGGSVAHGDPAIDLPAALLALDADVRRAGTGGRRAPSRRRDFFRGFLETALAPDELLTEIRVPQDRRQRVRVPEVQPAGAGLGDRRRARGPRSAAARRVGAREHGIDAAARDCGRAGARQGASAADAAEQADAGTEPPADLNASVEYRAHLAACSCGRALEASA